MTKALLIQSLFVFNLFLRTLFVSKNSIFSVLQILNTNLFNPSTFSLLTSFMSIFSIDSDRSKRDILPTPTNDFFSTKDFLI